MPIADVTDGADSAKRVQLYHALGRRNRLVTLLRFLVPGIGVVFGAALVAQILIANAARELGVSGLRLERDQLVIETPQYSGVMADGTTYEVRAGGARASLQNLDAVDLAQTEIAITRPNGYRLWVTADQASFANGAQTVTVADRMTIADSNETTGWLTDAQIDLGRQVVDAKGPVNFQFEDGSSLDADSLRYDVANQTWSFGRTRFSLPQLPEAVQ